VGCSVDSDGAGSASVSVWCSSGCIGSGISVGSVGGASLKWCSVRGSVHGRAVVKVVVQKVISRGGGNANTIHSRRCVHSMRMCVVHIVCIMHRLTGTSRRVQNIDIFTHTNRCINTATSTTTSSYSTVNVGTSVERRVVAVAGGAPGQRVSHAVRPVWCEMIVCEMMVRYEGTEQYALDSPETQQHWIIRRWYEYT